MSEKARKGSDSEKWKRYVESSKERKIGRVETSDGTTFVIRKIKSVNKLILALGDAGFDFTRFSEATIGDAERKKLGMELFSIFVGNEVTARIFAKYVMYPKVVTEGQSDPENGIIAFEDIDDEDVEKIWNTITGEVKFFRGLPLGVPSSSPGGEVSQAPDRDTGTKTEGD